MLGLLRWVYLVPTYTDPNLDPGQRDSHAAVFRALHQYLGVGVGEHLGYLFPGIWSTLISIGIIQTTAVPTWLGWPGIMIGARLLLLGVGDDGRHVAAMDGRAADCRYSSAILARLDGKPVAECLAEMQKPDG